MDNKQEVITLTDMLRLGKMKLCDSCPSDKPKALAIHVCYKKCFINHQLSDKLYLVYCSDCAERFHSSHFAPYISKEVDKLYTPWEKGMEFVI